MSIAPAEITLALRPRSRVDVIDDVPTFRIAVADNVRKWRYILAILERWATEGRDDGTRQRDTETKRRWYTDEEFEQFFEH